MPQQAVTPYKSDFLKTCISNGVLKFGSYKLKSGRLSPYFFDAGEFYSGEMLHAISTAFAQTIIESDSISSTSSNYDVLFGPAYKGIPLATATVAKLADLQPKKYRSLCYSFDRKEVKDHGEGGMIVGAPLKDKKILIVDDVVTAGTAKREAIEKIQKLGGTVVGIIVALDRMENLLASSSDDNPKNSSAIGELRKEFSIPVLSILSLNDIIDGLQVMGMHDELQKMLEYRELYQTSE